MVEKATSAADGATQSGEDHRPLLLGPSYGPFGATSRRLGPSDLRFREAMVVGSRQM